MEEWKKEFSELCKGSILIQIEKEDLMKKYWDALVKEAKEGKVNKEEFSSIISGMRLFSWIIYDCVV